LIKDLFNEWRWKVKGSKKGVQFTKVAIWYQKKASRNGGNVMLEKYPGVDNTQLDVIFDEFL
jgi:hypothetical protein